VSQLQLIPAIREFKIATDFENALNYAVIASVGFGTQVRKNLIVLLVAYLMDIGIDTRQLARDVL
jgi:hypothetical protein